MIEQTGPAVVMPHPNVPSSVSTTHTAPFQGAGCRAAGCGGIEADLPRALAVAQVFHAVKPGEVKQQRDGKKSAKKTPWNV